MKTVYWIGIVLSIAVALGVAGYLVTKQDFCKEEKVVASSNTYNTLVDYILFNADNCIPLNISKDGKDRILVNYGCLT
jgi:hypothetical protein